MGKMKCQHKGIHNSTCVYARVISLENWLRNKLSENEEMHDYSVATDTIRCWIDEYNNPNLTTLRNI